MMYDKDVLKCKDVLRGCVLPASMAGKKALWMVVLLVDLMAASKDKHLVAKMVAPKVQS